jgi:Uma2 family endonuclease
VRVPDWVVDLESFRRWADAGDFPEKDRIWFRKGGVWVDMSKEQVFTHVAVKTELNAVLSTLVKGERLGRYWADGVFLSNVGADIAGKPDGTFVSWKTLQAERVRLVDGMEEGPRELEGSPAMVLEVVSRSSVHKDTVTLRQACWEAGIREYWLVDVRQEPLRFHILRNTTAGYVAGRRLFVASGFAEGRTGAGSCRRKWRCGRPRRD